MSIHGGPAPRNAKEAQALALIETIRQSLTEGRVDLYLQPVVSLPQRKTIFYESFSRLRDSTGRVLMPAEYLSAADAEGLVPSIDNLLLFRCVQIVRRLAKQDRRIGIFCNISQTSLRDDTFFPQFLEFLSENRDLAGALIFELGQHAFDARGSVEARHMAKLADLGFRFSIDKVASIDFDLQDLHRSDVRFVKIGAGLLLEQLLSISGKPALKFMKDIHAGDYVALLARYGIEVIAEKVENEPPGRRRARYRDRLRPGPSVRRTARHQGAGAAGNGAAGGLYARPPCHRPDGGRSSKQARIPSTTRR